MKRQDLRKYAFLISFGMSFSFDEPQEALENSFHSFKEDYETEHGKFSKKDLEFIFDIISGVYNNKEEIDVIISKYAKDYDITRISKVAVSALRVCLYEILKRDDIPNSVSVNEAVEIVKEYSDDKTKKFVNGILGSYLNEISN